MTPWYIKDALGNEMYPQNTEGDEEFLLRNGRPYYAKDRHQREMYPVVLGIELPIPDQYAKDADDNEYYPKDKNGVEYTLSGPEFRYARDKNGQSFYPRDTANAEVVHLDQYITHPDGTIQYPVGANEKPIYPVGEEGEEYVVTNGKMNLGKSRDGVPWYARRLNGDEYYPRDEYDRVFYGYYPNGRPIYALDAQGVPIFPKYKSGDEFYLVHSKTKVDERYAAGAELPTYARKKNGDEFYPRELTANNNIMEVPLGDRYARYNSFEPIYPLDENGNEYILWKAKKKFPLGYPRTHDGWLIVPQVNEQPHMVPGFRVKVENLVGMLQRDNGWDYITDVKATRLSRRRKKGPYKVIAITYKPSQQPPQQPQPGQPPQQPQPGQPPQPVQPVDPNPQPSQSAPQYLPSPNTTPTTAYIVALCFIVIIALTLAGKT